MALGALVPGVARAATEGPATAVLGLEATDAPPAVADEIAEQLRQRVTASTDLRLVSGKDLVELKLVFACADEAHACMAQAGMSLGADKLIYGSVKKSGDDFAVWLKLFDVKKEKVESWLTETLPAGHADASGIKAASARWFAKLSGHPLNVGTLLVSANLFGATVTLDGIPVGLTSEQPLTVSEVKTGKHEVVVTKAGHASAQQQFLVAAGQTVSLNLTLRPVAAEAAAAVAAPSAAAASVAATDTEIDKESPAAQSRDGRSAYRTGFWVTLGAGLISAGAAVKFGLDVLQVNKDLDQYRRFPCNNSPTGCDSKGNPAPALTPADHNAVNSKTDQGNRDRTLQWVCIGIGSALGLSSGYLFYKGYLDDDDAGARREAHRGLRIFPTASASSGGVLAEFDF